MRDDDVSEEREFTEWASGCQHRLLRTAFLLTGDLATAEDLVQEALVKVALRWGRLREGNPAAYARTILARDNVSRWRRHRREVLREPSAHEGAAAVAGSSDDALVVRRALARLTQGQRAVVVLRHFEDLSEREVAGILGVSVGTVKSQNAAGLTRLRTAAPELLDLIGRNP